MSRFVTGLSAECEIRFVYLFVCLMVCNTTFNNISVILWQ